MGIPTYPIQSDALAQAQRRLSDGSNQELVLVRAKLTEEVRRSKSYRASVGVAEVRVSQLLLAHIALVSTQQSQ